MTKQQWLQISIINLLVLAVVGIILRYKIAFSLEWISQKHLLHGHSHFAFYGWVAQAIMTLIIEALSIQQNKNLFPKYKWYLILNFLAAYAMLISFSIQGYGLFSISFSTFSILVSYAFGFDIWRSINRQSQKSNSHLLLKSGILFNVVSSSGAFALAFMMANKITHQNWYLASTYFFLHFQYNGYFFMASLGLLVHHLEQYNIHIERIRTISLLSVISCLPAYFLSTLWMNLPLWIYIVVIAAALSQLIAWIMFIKAIRKHIHFLVRRIHTSAKWLLLFASIALSIKFILQLGSTIPALSNWAFGFRPIVIGYLHLMLLGVITLSLIAFALHTNLLASTANVLRGIVIFVCGIVANEFILMLQGAGAIIYTIIPYADVMLLAAAVIMAIGLLFMISGNRYHSEVTPN